MKNLSGLMAVLAIFLFASVSYGQLYEKRINFGSSTTDDVTFINETFTPDAQATGFTSTTNLVSNNLSYNGLAEPLKSIQYTKNANMRFNFNGLPAGTYTVKLHFAEVYWGVAPGHGANEKDKRHFSIDIDGQWSTADYNIFNASGGTAFHSISEDVTVSDGNILITLGAIGTGNDRKNDPVISAIEIFQAASSNIDVTGVTLNATTATLEVGSSQTLLAAVAPSNATVNTGQWSSTDTSIATVNNGVVTAIAPGAATVSFTTTDGGFVASSTITVNPVNAPDVDVTGVTLSTLNAMLQVGTTQQLIATVTPSNATNKTGNWTSADTAIASVVNGLVTALSAGATTVNFTTNDGNFTAEATVTVTESDVPSTPAGDLWQTTNNIDAFLLNGNVGIGTTAQANYRLAVDGKIHTKEVKVDEIGWADYVFKEDYKLPTLAEVAQHIKEKGHLINIPSAAEVEANGIELGEMNKLLLEKIEELTLYILEQEKARKALEERINSLEIKN